ncbi:MAG: hypothetical protein ABI574_18755 [Burkholderiales bacterium]
MALRAACARNSSCKKRKSIFAVAEGKHADEARDIETADEGDIPVSIQRRKVAAMLAATTQGDASFVSTEGVASASARFILTIVSSHINAKNSQPRPR